MISWFKPGIVMIGAAQHDDADAVFALQLIERLPRLAAHLSLVFEQGLEAGFDGAFVFFRATGPASAPTP